MTSVRPGKADIAAASAISRSLLSWAAHHPIPCTTRIVNAALDIALALRRMPASGGLRAAPTEAPGRLRIDLNRLVLSLRAHTPRCASRPTDSWSPRPIPPSGPRCATLFKKLAVPDGYRPRGSPAADTAPRPERDRDHAKQIDRRSRQKAIAMPMLRHSNPHALAAQKSITQ
jgi:hypothetical protein